MMRMREEKEEDTGEREAAERERAPQKDSQKYW